MAHNAPEDDGTFVVLSTTTMNPNERVILKTTQASRYFPVSPTAGAVIGMYAPDEEINANDKAKPIDTSGMHPVRKTITAGVSFIQRSKWGQSLMLSAFGRKAKKAKDAVETASVRIGNLRHPSALWDVDHNGLQLESQFEVINLERGECERQTESVDANCKGSLVSAPLDANGPSYNSYDFVRTCDELSEELDDDAEKLR